MLSARALLSGRCVQASATAATLLSMLDDYDRLLSSDSNFMLGEHHRWPIPDSAPNPVAELQRCHTNLRCVAGPWIKWARSWSDDKEEQDFFEFNASAAGSPLRLLSKSQKKRLCRRATRSRCGDRRARSMTVRMKA